MHSLLLSLKTPPFPALARKTFSRWCCLKSQGRWEGDQGVGAFDKFLPKRTRYALHTLFSKEVRFHVPPENLVLLFSTISKFWQKSLSCRAFIEEELVNVRRLPPSSNPSPLHSFLMAINTRCNITPFFQEAIGGRKAFLLQDMILYCFW